MFALAKLGFKTTVSCHRNRWETEKQVFLNQADHCLSFQQPHHIPITQYKLSEQFPLSHPCFGQAYHYFNMLLLIQLIPYTPLPITEVVLAHTTLMSLNTRNESLGLPTPICVDQNHTKMKTVQSKFKNKVFHKFSSPAE